MSTKQAPQACPTLFFTKPFPPADGYRFTRRLVTVLNTDTSSETASKVPSHHWVSTFGIHSTATIDRGIQFQPKLFTGFSELLGLHIRTNAYHPSSNGLAKRSWKIKIFAHPKLPRN